MSDRFRRELVFHYDISSPFAYLGSTQVASVAARHDAVLTWRPFLLGGLFRDIGTPDVPLLAMCEAKQRYTSADIARWADHYGAAFRFPSRFPMNTVKALRMLLQVDGRARESLTHAFFRAYWVDDRDLQDEATLRALADGIGLDGSALVAATREESYKRMLREATDEARRAGVCGAPCFVVRIDDGALARELLFWGQDRLELVERALAGWEGGRGDRAAHA